MRYFYEYKYKNGCKVGGHNLESIIVKDNKILLKGADLIKTYDDYEYYNWSEVINMNEIEYLKIEPMEELEGNNE